MKRIFKYLSALLSTLLLVVMFTACTGGENSDPNAIPTGVLPPVTTDKAPEMSEDEIKNNFDQEVKKLSLSKKSINGAINTAISTASSDVDVDTILNSISVPNSKLDVVVKGKRTVGEESQKQEGTKNFYFWQKEDKVYACDNEQNKETVTVDLAQIKSYVSELIGGISGTPDQSQDTDYVGLILEAMNVPELPIDTYLSLIRFEGSDFTYSDGLFTLSKEALINKVVNLFGVNDSSQVESIKAMVSAYITDLYVQIGYNGSNFTRFKLYVKPNLASIVENASLGAMNAEATLDMRLGYTAGKVSVASLNVDATATQGPNRMTADLDLIASMKGIEFKMNVDLHSELTYDGYSNTTNTKANVSLILDVEKKTIDFDMTSSTSYDVKNTTDDINESHSNEFTCSLDASEKGIDLKFTETSKGNNESYGTFEEVRDVTAKLETGIEIPADVVATEATATDVTQTVIDKINNMISQITKSEVIK